MILENIEGLPSWNIRPDWAENRRSGISAFMRVRNETEWLGYSVASILPVMDEIVIALQGDTQDDDTEEIARGLERAFPDIVRVVKFPFLSRTNGPGHGDQARDSLHERAYFYNWALAQTTRAWACKWDGDMVAFGLLGAALRDAMSGNAVAVKGVEICGADLRCMSREESTPLEPRFFRVTPETFYVTGSHCEALNRMPAPHHTIGGASFLHFKWAKDRAAATQAWPHGWEKLEHFRRLIERKATPGEVWNGPWPACMLGRVKQRRPDAGPELLRTA